MSEPELELRANVKWGCPWTAVPPFLLVYGALAPLICLVSWHAQGPLHRTEGDSILTWAASLMFFAVQVGQIVLLRRRRVVLFRRYARFVRALSSLHVDLALVADVVLRSDPYGTARIEMKLLNGAVIHPFGYGTSREMASRVVESLRARIRMIGTSDNELIATGGGRS